MATEDGGQLKLKTFVLNSALISALFTPSCDYIGIPATISDSMPQWSSPRRILKYPEVTKNKMGQMKQMPAHYVKSAG